MTEALFYSAAVLIITVIIIRRKRFRRSADIRGFNAELAIINDFDVYRGPAETDAASIEIIPRTKFFAKAGKVVVKQLPV